MRLLIVSNRLPFTVTDKDGKFRFKESVGGLVSGLSAYLDSMKSPLLNAAESLWVGWPGLSVKDKTKEKLKAKALSEFKACPVFLTEKDMECFYYGFCNKTIWPLFHYFPSYAIYEKDYWEHYRKVNEAFCDVVMEVVKSNDTIWVHDYHLMLLPKLLREKNPDLPIGFFLHIPFPSYEIFRIFPRQWGREILEGLLGADLIGFHTHDYTQDFLKCVLRILGHEHGMGKIFLGDRLVRADTFPMAVDFKKYNQAGSLPVVQKEIKKLNKIKKFKIILSVDRLDYTKGIINRLQGFELFLERNPQWHNKVMLVLVIVPSRVGVEQYQQIKKKIDESVGEINGRFGSIHWSPIVYQYKFLPLYPLTAYYCISDVALITPLRDGMNLVAKEYIASRADQRGILILSEMTGAAKELGEAILVNPNNVEEIADSLRQALEMPAEEQMRRNKIMRERLERYDVVRWAEDFNQELSDIKEEQQKLKARLLDVSMKKSLREDFKRAERRIIFLDYDGTLVSFAKDPRLTKPDDELLALLKAVMQVDATEVILISGRDKNTLERWFATLDVGLIAEHGVWIREKGLKQWNLLKPLTAQWKPQILPLLNVSCDRLPGSFIEEKEFSVVWHYRGADPELSSIRAKELADELIHFTATTDVQILQGNKVVEIRNGGVNKGTACMQFLSKGHYNFILAVGDDWTDEDMFKVLPPEAYSIKVGICASHARFNLRHYQEIRKLLVELIP